MGTDKRNPVFSVFRNPEQNQLHVYYGAELLERVPDDREHVEYKLLVARLYNAHVKATVLAEVFRVDRKTMSRWGEALKSGEPERLLQVLAGRSARRKLTAEIEAYVRMRFPSIYRETKYDYSKRSREEVEQVFGVSLSGETLRPLLKQLKEKENEVDPEKREMDWERENAASCEGDKSGEKGCAKEGETGLIPRGSETGENPNRKESPDLRDGASDSFKLCHHLGVLLFSEALGRLEAEMGEAGGLLKQWVVTLLLGAVNIEQTKWLDFGDLKGLLGQSVRTQHEQRCQLGELVKLGMAERVLRFNAMEVNATDGRDFYYDPHTKHYTGMKKILKGWCPSIRFADKALHMDFLHTAQGQPVYMEPTDNYQDLRERFFPTVRKFRDLLELDDETTLTFIVDRGIYSQKVFARILQDPASHLVTWEKGYEPEPWPRELTPKSFCMERSRNRAADIQTYTFDYVEEAWPKEEAMRRIRVRAANPKGRTIEVGILTDDRKREASELIALMFRRWLQENDFKYLDHHFGINEITSYAAVPYKKLKEHLEDKQMKSGTYKAWQMERKQLQDRLGRLTAQEHLSPCRNPKRTQQIQDLLQRLDELQQDLKTMEQEISRLEFLVEQDYVRLDTRNKHLMDALKLLARNLFYNRLEPFKKAYDNYRDDHALFRTLTQSDGVIRQQDGEVEAILLPKPNYPPKVRRIIEQILDDINAATPMMPDGSQRPLRIRLGKKGEFKLAIDSE